MGGSPADTLLSDGPLAQAIVTLNPLFASMTTLAKSLRAGEVSAVDVLHLYLNRIRALNPEINALIVEAPDALEWAQQADEDLARGTVQGPLHGVPFTVKDVIATAALQSPLDETIRKRRSTLDATVVARLQEAGGILLGKSNCPPGGGGSDTENALCGRTLNPHDLSRSPGGSSGGEAALLAAGGTPLGLGVDSSGGARIPAAYCGVVALKPTNGRLPNTGIYNIAGGLTDPRTQVAPMARSVADIEQIFRLLAGPDYVDASVIPMPVFDPAEVVPGRLRIAYFRQDPASPVSREVGDAVENVAGVLEQAGIAVEEALPSNLVERGREIDRGWREIPGTRGQDLIEFFGAWDHYRALLLQFMVRFDALICPVDHHVAPPFHVRDPQRFDYTVPFSLTGYPALSLPVGQSREGLPLAVQIVSHPWREDVVLRLGALLEDALGGWHPPDL